MVAVEHFQLKDLLKEVTQSCNSFDWEAGTRAVIQEGGIKSIPDLAGSLARVLAMMNICFSQTNPSKESASAFPLILAAALVATYRPENEGMVAAFESIFSEQAMSLTKAIYAAMVQPYQDANDRDQAAKALMEVMQKMGYLGDNRDV